MQRISSVAVEADNDERLAAALLSREFDVLKERHHRVIDRTGDAEIDHGQAPLKR